MITSITVPDASDELTATLISNSVVLYTSDDRALLRKRIATALGDIRQLGEKRERDWHYLFVIVGGLAAFSWLVTIAGALIATKANKDTNDQLRIYQRWHTSAVEQRRDVAAKYLNLDDEWQKKYKQLEVRFDRQRQITEHMALDIEVMQEMVAWMRTEQRKPSRPVNPNDGLAPPREKTSP